ncbi:MAG: hypothetical protein JXR37_33585 [Kiritimatiellae bacterium]|nr:hypothetical protein [Kiritimatiellia bacterium]
MSARLQPYGKNPTYWEWDGKPTIPLGGSDDDNIFNALPQDEVVRQLDRVRAAGGNYDRCTVSHRTDRGIEIKPYKRLENGKYDLAQWNDTYWNQFDRYLSLCREREIIVQVEIWATYDYVAPAWWAENPFRPANNVNYGGAQTSLPDVQVNDYDHPDRTLFMRTVPALNDDKVVYPYQQAFVDKVLSHTFTYDNILYCIDNEFWSQTRHNSMAWPDHWVRYIRAKAEAAGKTVYIGEMFWPIPRPIDANMQYVMDHPELYDFLDYACVGNMHEQTFWDHHASAHAYMARTSKPRPINHDKMYGADTNTSRRYEETDTEAIDRVWRVILGGAASARFHRPPTGIGNSDAAMASIRAMRKFIQVMPPWECSPRMDLLSERMDNEAYVTVNPGQAYGLFFPGHFRGPKSVKLDLRETGGALRLRWINIGTGEFDGEETIAGGAPCRIAAPLEGSAHGWAAVITRGPEHP